MSKSRWFVLGLVMVLSASLAFAAPFTPQQVVNPEVAKVQGTQSQSSNALDEDLYTWDFEGDESGWEFVDGAAQSEYWQVDDWDPHGGTNAWHCYSADIGGDNGGYSDGWLQSLASQDMDLSGATAAELSFWFKISAESGNWDGATVWVAYGADAESATWEIATPTSPAYNQTALAAMEDWFLGTDMPGWSGETEADGFWSWTEATFDLSSYVGNAYVKVMLVFASDGAYNSADNPDMFGFVVDDISLTVDATETWADDADGNVVGTTEIMTGASATPDVLVYDNPFTITEPAGAPSATHALSVVMESNHYLTNHYYITPEDESIDLPELDPGQTLFLDLMQKGAWEATGSFPNVPYWRWEVWDPEQGTWHAGSNVRGITGSNYVYTNASADWGLFSENFGTPWELSPMGGVEGVRFRAYWHTSSQDNDYTFTEFHMDDVVVVQNSLEHDVATSIWTPYPTTVGTGVWGTVTYSNNPVSPNAESGFAGIWGLGTANWPVYPDGTSLSIEVGGETVQQFNNPTDPDAEGYWVPGSAGEVDLIATHTLSTDQIPDNDEGVASIEVMEEGYYEFGPGSRSFTTSLVVYPESGDPYIVGSGSRIVPAELNPDFFEQMGEVESWAITELRGQFYFHPSISGVQASGDVMNVTVWEDDGGAPGAEIWSGTFNWIDDGGLAEGYTGAAPFRMDVSSVAALQELTVGGVFVTLEMTSTAGGYHVPFMYETVFGPNQANFFDVLDDGTVSASEDEAWYLSAVTTITFVEDDVAEIGSELPNEFALHNAYPNPFNPSTAISFDVAKAQHVSLKVYNLMGQEVATLIDRQIQPGAFKTTWNAQNLSSGVYFVRMETQGFNAVQKVMLMK